MNNPAVGRSHVKEQKRNRVEHHQESRRLEDWRRAHDRAQSSYLHTLADQADTPEKAEGDLTKAEASKRIDHLREEVGLAHDEKSPPDH